MSASERVVVLNVDDQEAERYVKTRDLRHGGFEVIEASTGMEALRIVEDMQPPVVLLDVQLPDINGFEVCAFIKKKWPHVMVLQTSATFTSSADRTIGLDSGADSFLVQPAEPLELAAAINALLRIRRGEDALRALNASLEQRVIERTADLAATNAKLSNEIAQRQRAEAALAQAQKMEAVGQLTGGLAHDFNNLLTAVVGNLDLIRIRATDQRIVRHADNAFKAAERGAKLTAQLLAFSRTQKLATVPVDVNTLILGMSELLNQTLGANVTVQFELHPSCPFGMADVNQLELALLNLAINARDAMPDGGVITLQTGIDASDESRIVVCVTDTGTGMSDETLARAFDPFFTTKPPGKGTGLGLSQVYGIVRQFGGDVVIETKLGFGTTIKMFLPRTFQEAPVQLANAPTSSDGNSEALLVVDDDPDVREIITSVLSDVGYVVHEASHGEAALAILETVTPNLLILDFAMPGNSGAEIAATVRERHPKMPILFVSGYADSAALERAVGSASLLRKPFRPAELAAAVRSALSR